MPFVAFVALFAVLFLALGVVIFTWTLVGVLLALPAGGVMEIVPLLDTWFAQGERLFGPAVPATAIAVSGIVLVLSLWRMRRLVRSDAAPALFAGPWRGTQDVSIWRTYLAYTVYIYLITISALTGLEAVRTLTGVNGSFYGWGAGMAFFAVPGALIWAPLALRGFDAIFNKRELEASKRGYRPAHFHFRRRSVQRYIFRGVVFVVPAILAVLYVLGVQQLATLAGQIASGNTEVGPWPTVGTGPVPGSFTLAYAAVALPLVWAAVWQWRSITARVLNGHARHQYVRMVIGMFFILGGAAVAITASVPFLSHGTLTLATWVVTAAAAIALYVYWSNRWRGEGNAPRFLAGVFNPVPRVGQVWTGWHFPEKDATGNSKGEAKIRPLVIIDRVGDELLVCYFTSGAYARRESNRHEFVYIDNQSQVFRGMKNLIDKDKDSDEGFIKRKAQRIHKDLLVNSIERCPQDIYALLCFFNNVPVDPQARTIDRPTPGFEVSRTRGRTDGNPKRPSDHGDTDTAPSELTQH